ncbi:MAG TPA: HD domain-containing phosphohydrolase [Blastocatellia bacterium]|nr:HD domain-containing phosphohydrolase [Blastocatellia bacterium]
MADEACLTYKHRSGEHRALKFGAKPFRIGRLENNDLAFDNPYISRHHAEITHQESGYMLRDLGSTSGTYVNGDRVGEHLLTDGDVIRLGRARGVEFIFHASGLPEGFEITTDENLTPVRVITPEDTKFLDTSRLPRTDALADRTLEWLRALYEFTSELLRSHSTQELSDRLAAFVHRTLHGERCAVLLRDIGTDTLKLAATCDPQAIVSPSRSITRLVCDDNVAVLSLDARNDERFSTGDSARLQSIRSVMCAPIGSGNRVWGVCYIDNLKNDRAFDDESLEFLTAVARQAGLAMENLYLLEEQRRSVESFIRTLALSLDARDESTAGHSARVGAMAGGIARTMGLSEEVIRVVYYAGLLHDYGKIGVRDDVLLKPAELTEEEYEHVKQHPQHTFRLLSNIRFPADLSEVPFVAAAHHERWDGTGYPHGLKGEDIPLGSRIVSVADAYDAITEERCYSEPWSPEKALVALTMRSGTYFDPTVIEAFVQYFSSEIEPRHRRLQSRKTLKEQVTEGGTKKNEQEESLAQSADESSFQERAF